MSEEAARAMPSILLDDHGALGHRSHLGHERDGAANCIVHCSGPAWIPITACVGITFIFNCNDYDYIPNGLIVRVGCCQPSAQPPFLPTCSIARSPAR